MWSRAWCILIPLYSLLQVQGMRMGLCLPWVNKIMLQWCYVYLFGGLFIVTGHDKVIYLTQHEDLFSFICCSMYMVLLLRSTSLVVPFFCLILLWTCFHTIQHMYCLCSCMWWYLNRVNASYASLASPPYTFLLYLAAMEKNSLCIGCSTHDE